MGSTCSINRSKQQKQQSVDQLSFECDEYGEMNPDPIEPPPPKPKITKAGPKPFDPEEDDVSDTWGWVSAKQLHNYFYEGFYAPFILNPEYMLIVDSRPEDAFRQAHIMTSQWHGHVRLHDNDTMDLNRYSIIILCDEDGAADENSTVRRIQQFMVRRDSSLEPMIVRGGMETIERQFPYMMTGLNFAGKTEAEDVANANDAVSVSTTKSAGGTSGKSSAPPNNPADSRQAALIPWFPSIIIDYSLYMGRTEHALNAKVIKTLNITHVVNLSSKSPGIFPFVSYLCIPVDHESSDADLRSYFAEINAQISKALSSGGRVLVHCDEGVDPSATIVIAFLMTEKGCSLADAHDYVKSLRPIIQPSENYLSQLSDYETELYGRKYTSIEDLWI